MEPEPSRAQVAWHRRQGMTLAPIGIVAGLIGAVSLTRVMATLLFGVSATDAVTFSALTLFPAAVALAACCIQAVRAMRVDPGFVDAGASQSCR